MVAIRRFDNIGSRGVSCSAVRYYWAAMLSPRSDSVSLLCEVGARKRFVTSGMHCCRYKAFRYYRVVMWPPRCDFLFACRDVVATERFATTLLRCCHYRAVRYYWFVMFAPKSDLLLLCSDVCATERFVIIGSPCKRRNVAIRSRCGRRCAICCFWVAMILPRSDLLPVVSGVAAIAIRCYLVALWLQQRCWVAI